MWSKHGEVMERCVKKEGVLMCSFKQGNKTASITFGVGPHGEVQLIETAGDAELIASQAERKKKQVEIKGFERDGEF